MVFNQTKTNRATVFVLVRALIEQFLLFPQCHHVAYLVSERFCSLRKGLMDLSNATENCQSSTLYPET